MLYTLNILILGEPTNTNFYMSKAIGELGENLGDCYKLNTEMQILNDKCILETDVITNLITDFDESICRADGIIFFLNPLVQKEKVRFKLIINNIFSVIKRPIPVIIVFYDKNGILPISVKELLEEIWFNYSSLEAFVNIPPHEFYQVLQCLCLAMIQGEAPLNIENAWMRFPILIQIANRNYYKKKYSKAALAVKKALKIAKIYNIQEYFIICEQAAHLFSKLNLFLEVSGIMEDVDIVKWYNNKRKHVVQMILEGNKEFGSGNYEGAAEQYEKTAYWSSNELDGVKDRNLIDKAYNCAIHSWVHAFKFENAFSILKNLHQRERLNILKKIFDEIITALDKLKEKGEYPQVREQLHIAIFMYQQHDTLSKNLKELYVKLKEVLVDIFEDCVTRKEKLEALEIYEQIESIWHYCSRVELGLDVFLEKLILLFLEENKMEKTVYFLFNRISSKALKDEINSKIVKIEEQERRIREEEREISKSIFDLEQDFVKLQSKIGDFLRDRNEFLQKREILKNRWYADVLVPLKSSNFNVAADVYIKLANDFFYRKDLVNFYFLILLCGLSLLKAGEDIIMIKVKIMNFLSSLGKNEESLKISFYGLLLFCLIEAKLLKRDNILKQIKKILVNLPLLGEENELIKS